MAFPPLLYTGGFAALLILVTWTIIRDYKRWVIFGNGNPPNSTGLLDYMCYELQKWYLQVVRHDVLASDPLRKLGDCRTYLPPVVRSSLREGIRPTLVSWLLPQRIAPPYLHDPMVHEAILGLLEKIYEEQRRTVSDLRLEISRLEGVGQSLQLADDSKSVCQDVRTTFHELCHIHQQDLSFHVVLSPNDAATVLDNRWGERFALSGRRMRVGRLKGRTVPEGYVLVYTPRTIQEVKIVKEVIVASIKYGLSG